MLGLQDLPQIIVAVGGLGTAAFGLVEASKAFWGGANRIGFQGIRTAVSALTPPSAAPGQPPNALSQQKILATLQANWYNGTDLTSQKAIAKSLIKLNLSASNAATLAAETGVDPAILTAVASSIAAGAVLTPAQSDVYSRFDLIVTALLDEAYQRGDQQFRNGTKAWAMVSAIVLAVLGALVLHSAANQVHTANQLTLGQDIAEAVLVGILATPLAPVAKDLSTALATAVNAMQLIKK